jgi:hypothetical protein
VESARPRRRRRWWKMWKNHLLRCRARISIQGHLPWRPTSPSPQYQSPYESEIDDTHPFLWTRFRLDSFAPDFNYRWFEAKLRAESKMSSSFSPMSMTKSPIQLNVNRYQEFSFWNFSRVNCKEERMMMLKITLTASGWKDNDDNLCKRTWISDDWNRMTIPISWFSNLFRKKRFLLNFFLSFLPQFLK